MHIAGQLTRNLYVHSFFGLHKMKADEIFWWTMLTVVIWPHTVFAQLLSNPSATVEAQKTYEFLTNYQVQTDQCIILGQNIGWSMEEFEPLVADLARETGSWPGIIGGQLRPFPDEIDYDSLLELTISWSRAGGLVEFSMLPNNPFTGGDAWDITQTDVHGLLTEGGLPLANWRAELDLYAAFLSRLQEHSIPVLWRPLMEMNGDWFWYGFHGSDNPEPFINLYRDLFDYFTHTWGLNNLIWVFCANASYDGIPEVDHYYPGDDVVDIVGLDIYVTDLDIPLAQYQKMLALNKPFAIPEFGPSFEDMNGMEDYAAYLDKFRRDFPATIYTIAWHSWPEHKAAWIDNMNFTTAFREDCVMNRDEIGAFFATSVHVESLPSPWQIFPNPVRQRETLRIIGEGIGTLSIYNILGNSIHNFTLTSRNDGVDLHIDEGPGAYFFTIKPCRKENQPNDPCEVATHPS